MQSASTPYCPPSMRNKRQKTQQRFNKNKGFNMEENADLFPELPFNSQKNDEISEQNVCDDTKTFSHLIENNTQTEEKHQNNTNKLQDGWIEITEKDTRKSLASHRVTRKTNKQDFIERIYEQERYIHSLSDNEYKQLCHKTMDNLVDIYKRQRLEFIQTYGYEYYNSIYGYEPVYHRRVVCKRLPKMTENSYESDDNSQMSDRYVEYYTDDDDWDADSMKEYDTIDDAEDEYNE
jgi:hypothetical protein